MVSLGKVWGGGVLKSLKTLRAEGSGSNLVGKISRIHRYMIVIIGMDLLYLGELGGGGVSSEKLEKITHF